ncbi:MAG: endonuclease III [Nanoarchaeota archaeon]|nr:MAG: endonuclease III [Nanoarchaeota archaeon]
MKPMLIGKVHDTLEHFVSTFEAPVVTLMKVRGADPFKILVSTILSARTNDKITAPATTRLFKTVKKLNDLNKLSTKQIESLIYPVGFYKTKAKHLKELPKAINENFDGKIPKTIDELIQLPGVGRKTANLVMTEAFDEDAICVDTHIHRIMNRLGYVKTKNTFQTEMVLRKKLPKQYWKSINHILVAFGQQHCTPINPKCSTCPVRIYCNRIGVKKSR